jgi:hypothetical protein
VTRTIRSLSHSLAGLGEDEKGFEDDLLLGERGSLMASAPPTHAASPTAWRACWDAGCAPEPPLGAGGPTLPTARAGSLAF